MHVVDPWALCYQKQAVGCIENLLLKEGECSNSKFT